MGEPAVVHLLLVEDNPVDARLVQEGLREHGSRDFEITHVQTLSESVTALAESPFDLILLDLGLPDVTGLDGLQRLVALDLRIPIVVLTGLSDEGIGEKAISLGADEYLPKQVISGKALARSIRYALSRHEGRLAILESEDRLQDLVESVADGVLIVDQEKKILLANGAARGMLSADREIQVGKQIPFGEWVDTGEVVLDGEAGTRRYELRCGDIQWFGEAVQVISLRDITERTALRRELEQTIEKLEEALREVRTLKGFIPICAVCKKIRNDEGFWEDVSAYISEHSDAKMTHGVCPDCMKEMYPEYVDQDEETS